MSKKAEQLSQTPILTQKQVSKANRQDSSKLDATPCSLCEGMGELDGFGGGGRIECHKCDGTGKLKQPITTMKKPILEEILKVASFDYDEEGKLILTKLNADLVGDHKGDHKGDHHGTHEGNHYGNHVGYHIGNHYGNHVGDHEGRHIGKHFGKHIGDHIGNHYGNHVGDHEGTHKGNHWGDQFGTHKGNHWGDHKGDHITPKPEKTAQNKN